MVGIEPALSKGNATRAQILDKAIEAASIEGLEGITIGRLAELTGMSKSGLIRHFNNKEGLQIAILEIAAARFDAEVSEPSLNSDPGLLRLKALIKYWLIYLESGPYRGGCIWQQASADFDSRSGPVQAKLQEIQADRYELIRHQVAIAMARRQIELRGKTAEDIAFSLYALINGVAWVRQSLGRSDAMTLGRRAIESLIGYLN